MENTQNSKENDYRENSLKVCLCLVIWCLLITIVMSLIYSERWKDLKYLFVIIILYELLQAFVRFQRGKVLYKKAQNIAKQNGMDLIVIGNPNSSWKNRLWGPAYGCGDECIDLVGCPVNSCKLGGIQKNHEPIDALKALQHRQNNSATVFESGTAHLVPGLKSEMKRVGDWRTFSVNADSSLIGLTSRITGAVLNG